MIGSICTSYLLLASSVSHSHVYVRTPCRKYFFHPYLPVSIGEIDGWASTIARVEVEFLKCLISPGYDDRYVVETVAIYSIWIVNWIAGN